MELLFAAAALWHRKLIVVVGMVAAVAAGVLYGSRPPADAGFTATARVLVDTPDSQLVDADPAPADTLPWRAEMLANLMKTQKMTQRMAAIMGVRPDEVDVANLELATPQVAASIPTLASKSSELVYAPYVVSPSVPDAAVPLIALTASAPDAAHAKKLASAAVDALREQSTGPGRYTSPITNGQGNSQLEPLDIRQITPIQMESLTKPVKPIVPVAVALVVFMMWCAGVVFVLAPLTRRRARRPRYVPV